MTHSPEPWSVYGKAPQLVDKDGVHFLDLTSIRYGTVESREPDPADMKRIVACVNACEGIPDGDVDIVSRMAKVKRQSDELLKTFGLDGAVDEAWIAEYVLLCLGRKVKVRFVG